MKVEELTSRHREEDTAVSRALDWLVKHYEPQVSEVLDTEFFGSLEEEDRDRLSEVSPNLQEMVHINSSEWYYIEENLWFYIYKERKLTRENIGYKWLLAVENGVENYRKSLQS